MAKINLRELFPEYEFNCFVEVTDGDEEAFASCITKEIADVYVGSMREEVAYKRRKYYHKAHYSLDLGDGIENDAVYHAPSPEELFMDRLDREELDAALATLPEKQGKRIYQYYFLGMNNVEIGKAEGISEKNVRKSIERGLLSLYEHMKNYF